MASKPKRIIALNLGMQKVCMGDFRLTPNGGLTIHAFQHAELLVDPAADVTRPEQIQVALTEMKADLGVKSETVQLCLPSQSVFTRFVKLPGQDAEEVRSIIGFEAQQNVPFPIDEVTWDYQIMGKQRDGSWDVVLVAMKSDQLSDLNRAVEGAGLKPGAIDVAPMALYNAFRFNYDDLTGCSLLIDIGSRTTNLIFIEGDKAFSRSIPIGGNAITMAIAKELNDDIDKAESLKIKQGFVGLGGAYAEPDDPTEAKLSKVIRNTMTRLHAEISRSISFYRANQAGSQPVRTFLCGGTVSLTYMREFFSEKLQMPIEFFNPLRNVTVSTPEAAEKLSGRAHVVGELIGAALRGAGEAPVEINLRPPSLVRAQDLDKRKPFLIGAVAILAMALGTWWYYFYNAAYQQEQVLNTVIAETTRLDEKAKRFDALAAEEARLKEVAAPLQLIAAERQIWSTILDELGGNLPERYIWITQLTPLVNGRAVTVGDGKPITAAPAAPAAAGAPPQRGAQPQGPPVISAIEVKGLYLENPKQATVIDDFVSNLEKSPIFSIDEKNRSKIVTQRSTPDQETWAYGYTLVLPLKQPIALQ